MGQTLQGNAGPDRGRWRALASLGTRLIARLGALVIVLALGGPVCPARGQAPDTAMSLVQVGAVTVFSWPGQSRAAVALGEMADRPFEYPGLGYRTAGELRLVLVPDAAAMRKVSGGRSPEWGAGLAFPSSRTIMLRADNGDLRRTLRHELAHLVLHGAVRTRVPLWFDEGYAALAAGEWDRMDALRLSWVVLRRDLPDFRELDAALRGNSGTAEKAYALAMSAVLELARRNPAGTLDSLLARLQQQESFEEAVFGATGLPLPVFEIDWARTIRRRYNVLIWLSAGGFWLLVSLGVAVVWYLRRRADRPRRRALDQGWIIPEAPDPEL